MARPPSYLAGMGRRERAASVVLALQCYGNLNEVYLGGEQQFRHVARPVLRNWGVADDDFDTIWRMIDFAVTQPRGFVRMCDEMDRQRRVPAERLS